MQESLPGAESVQDSSDCDAGITLRTPEPLKRRKPIGTQDRIDDHSARIYGALQAIEACIENHSDRIAFFDCLDRKTTAAITPEALGEWVCNTGYKTSDHRNALYAILRGLHLDEVFPFIDRFQMSCTKYRESNFLLDLFRQASDDFPEWYVALEPHLTPEALFLNAGGQGVIQAAKAFAENDGVWARFLLEEGGRGTFGGSEDQIFRAAGVALAIQNEGSEFLGYMKSVFDSSSAVPGVLGNHLGRFLLDGRAWPNGDSGDAMELLMQTLHDPRFMGSAARQVLSRNRKDPPPGCDSEFWEHLLARAFEVRLHRGE